MRGWVFWLLLAVCAVRPVDGNAQPDDAVIVGRADADASGGWPVALWVRDGRNSHFIVRAPREQLGGWPGHAWRAVDSQALMDLERFAAPDVWQFGELNPCPAGWGWSRFAGSAPSHAGTRLALRHPACRTANCAQPAWRIDLPTGDVLPLARLLPALAANKPGWLVLHVATSHPSIAVDGVRALRVPEPLRFIGRGSPDTFVPIAAMRHFPAIDVAMLEHAAVTQGLQRVSVLMRLQSVPLKYPFKGPYWNASEAQRAALGLPVGAEQTLDVFRLQLRLLPQDRPAELRLRAKRAPPEQWMSLSALAPEPVTPDSCRRELKALSCEPACARRIAADLSGADLKLDDLPPGERLTVCKAYCEQMKQGSREPQMKQAFAEVDERQREAWRFLEALTGRPAASWQTP